MFGSTAILPPRTKRWAEAKVLADSINLKVLQFFPSPCASDSQICRSANYIYTTMSTPLHSRNTLSIQGDLATSRAGGELAKRRLSFGAGLRGSEYLFFVSFTYPIADSPRDIAHLQSYSSKGQVRP